jgi:U6 snRNA-associated Sm-like protein LSm1
MFTTAAQLLDLTDSMPSTVLADTRAQSFRRRNHTEKLMLSLRDGRKLIGVLRSWDQFGVYLPVLREGGLRAPERKKQGS